MGRCRDLQVCTVLCVVRHTIHTNDVPAQWCHIYTFAGAGTRLSALSMNEVGDRALHGLASQVHTPHEATCCRAGGHMMYKHDMI